MRFQEFGNRFVIRLEDGEPVMQTLTEFLQQHQIGFTNVSAAGAVKGVCLGYWDSGAKQYNYREFQEQLETVSFQGNGALKEGKPFLHIHGVFGRSDYSVVGGHVKEAWVYPTFEVWLRTEDIAVRRSHDDRTGLDLLDLPLSTP